MILRAEGKKYTEEEFYSQILELSPYFNNRPDIDGLLQIDYDYQTLEIDDDLGYNIFHLALNGSINLLETGSTEMIYAAYEGKVVLESVDEYVTFEGNVFPKDEFISELINCGKRYIHLLESIKPKGKFDHLLEMMNPLLKKAEHLFKETTNS